MGDLNYKAFISYSHGDGKLVDWLHKGLEAYRPPKGVGAAVGRPLRPIFRDRAELSAAADLGEAIRTALDHSEFLIVVCSESARRSKWVGEEIRHFLSTHGPQRVICLLVDAPEGGGEVIDCLPQALREALPPGGEPLAADIRPGGDGRRLAFMKIAATLLGTRLDSLIQRDARRRTRWMTAITTGALGVALATGALALFAFDARRQAEEQRAEAEDLIAYMLGDLRKKLEPVGRLDVLDGVGARALAHYAHVNARDLDDDALSQQAKAQTLLGEIRQKRGDLKGARQALLQAASTSAALSEREPKNGQRLFDHAQNVFWLAYIDWRLGRTTDAEKGFVEYGALAERLTRLDPSNIDWKLEVAYAKSNLGTLLFEQGRPEALKAFEAARDGFEAADKVAPNDRQHISDLADAYGWVGDAMARQGRVREAYEQRQVAQRWLGRLVALDPNDRTSTAKARAGDLAAARRALDCGRVDESRRLIDRAQHGFLALNALDPQNATWLEYAATADLDAADLALFTGDLAGAGRAHDLAKARIDQLHELNPEIYVWSAKLGGRLGVQAVRLAEAAGRAGEAPARAVELERLLAERPGVRGDKSGEASYLGFARLAQGNAVSAEKALAPFASALTPEGRDYLARALRRQGRESEAQAIVRNLRFQGYARPDFVAFWRDSALG